MCDTAKTELGQLQSHTLALLLSKQKVLPYEHVLYSPLNLGSLTMQSLAPKSLI